MFTFRIARQGEVLVGIINKPRLCLIFKYSIEQSICINYFIKDNTMLEVKISILVFNQYGNLRKKVKGNGFC